MYILKEVELKEIKTFNEFLTWWNNGDYNSEVKGYFHERAMDNLKEFYETINSLDNNLIVLTDESILTAIETADFNLFISWWYDSNANNEKTKEYFHRNSMDDLGQFFKRISK